MIRDNKLSQDKVSKAFSKPLSKLCFNFSYITSNKKYNFKKLDNGNKINAYESLVKKLIELSPIEHNPPHIHAICGDNIGMFSLSGGEMFEGDLGNKEQKMVQKFIAEYENELLDM